MSMDFIICVCIGLSRFIIYPNITPSPDVFLLSAISGGILAFTDGGVRFFINFLQPQKTNLFETGVPT